MPTDEFIKGIDKDKIIRLSQKVREGWNDYFLESRYCQTQINFGVEERTNYMGDLLNYFDDTVELLEKIPMKPNYQLALYDTVSVLQLMYVGQDLIDELRFVFKMPSSSGDNKSMIRLLRNELTGHPISRDKENTFISSVFFTRNSHGEVIEYLRYHKDKEYNAEVIRHNWSELVKKHEEYLLENLNAILITVKNKLKAYQSQINKFYNSLPKISFEGIVNKTEHLLEVFFENSALYSKSNLLYFFQNHPTHPRYSHCTDLFIRDIKIALLETLNDIKELRSDEVSTQVEQSTDPIELKIGFFDGTGTGVESKSEQRNIRYQFSKLREKHPVFGIDYFMETYQNDQVLHAELSYLQSVCHDEREFHCSYEYLRHLFTTRGLL